MKKPLFPMFKLMTGVFASEEGRSVRSANNLNYYEKYFILVGKFGLNEEYMNLTPVYEEFNKLTVVTLNNIMFPGSGVLQDPFYIFVYRVYCRIVHIYNKSFAKKVVEFAVFIIMDVIFCFFNLFCFERLLSFRDDVLSLR